MMLPGQIENWVIITDFDHVQDMAKLKDALTVLFGVNPSYGTRLFRNYWVNPIEAFTNSVMKDHNEKKEAKLKIVYDIHNNEMWSHVCPSQVEMRFGGLIEGLLKGYWPPKCPNNKFLLPDEKESEIFITPKQYYQKEQNGELEGYRLNHN